MSRRLPHKGLRRAAFLRALADGNTVVAACAIGRLKWSTLYAWRRDEPEFRAAWDAAAAAGAEAMAARFDGELVRRALDGVDEPVFHAGEVVGHRRRYSDPLLMFGVRELRTRQPEIAPPPLIGRRPPVAVVIRRFPPPAQLPPESPPRLAPAAPAAKESGDG